MGQQAGGDLVQMPCMPCAGLGSTACAGCGGAGATFLSKSRLRFDRTLEFYQERVPCRLCFGTGRTMCLSCRGIGWTLQGQRAGAGPATREPASPAPRRRALQPTQPFAFMPYQFVYHPEDNTVWACWQYNPGHCLDYGSDRTQGRIELSACAPDCWLYIEDAGGARFPLEIHIASGSGLLGRWQR